MRTYGKVAVTGNGAWLAIRLEPHVALRFKRVFPKIERSAVGTLTLSCTPENCRDLVWFTERYPLQCVSGIEQIRARAREHREKQTLIDQFLSNMQAPLRFDLAIPPRDYQALAASIFLTTGNLLLADDVGTGKTVAAAAALVDPRVRPAVYVTLTHCHRLLGIYAVTFSEPSTNFDKPFC